MRAFKPLVIAGVAAAALIGAAAVAASGPQGHILTVRLPNGAVEQIRYFGDTPPRVIIHAGAPVGLDALGPVAFFEPVSPFAQMNRIQAQMDRQMAAMMAQAHAVQASALAGAAAPGLQQAAVGGLPAGTQSFSTISTFSGGHGCTRSVQVLSQGADKPPQVISKTSGDCGTAASTGGAAAAQRPANSTGEARPIAVKAEPKPAARTPGATI